MPHDKNDTPERLAGENGFKSGYVAVLGKPNVGKSTLINRFLGEKIAIVSSHPQTTRNNVTLILTGDNYQILFTDTPGMQESGDLLVKYMFAEARAAVERVDLLVIMLDASTGVEPADVRLLQEFSLSKKNKIIVVNKIDRVKKTRLLPLLEEAAKLCPAVEYIPLSALKGENSDRLLSIIVNSLPAGPAYFPTEQVSNKTERFHVSEIIREKILENTYQEIPYSVAVEIDEFQDLVRKNLIHIGAFIYVERESQKGIIIGNRGEMLKKIGTHARLDIERFLGKKVYLNLRVKVYEKWRKKGSALKRLVYG